MSAADAEDLVAQALKGDGFVDAVERILDEQLGEETKRDAAARIFVNALLRREEWAWRVWGKRAVPPAPVPMPGGDL